MQIPKNFQIFDKPSLIIVGDFEHAKLYMAQDENIEEINLIKAPEPHQPDVEGAVNIGGNRYANPSTDVDEGPRRLAYSKHLCSQIINLDAEKKLENIYLVFPAEMVRRITEELPNELKIKISKTLEKHMIDAPLIDVLQELN